MSPGSLDDVVVKSNDRRINLLVQMEASVRMGAGNWGNISLRLQTEMGSSVSVGIVIIIFKSDDRR